ncbi:ImmA/IrrE family metallo-endopeptidase [Tsukamurella spumae]|nr:ImmA/IrrE family metallo-endopeptidase [Tsukamurella spumae]
MTIAARHDWDPESRERSNVGREADVVVLDKIASAYRQAFPEGALVSATLPGDPAHTREVLGRGFVASFAERLESRLGVDVIRIPGLSTDYSLRIGGRAVIVLVSTPNWFRNNWSAAHELAHLALGHHDEGTGVRQNENSADLFAAELLLPEEEMRGIDWRVSTLADVAAELWNRGVSARALATRLKWLELADRELVDALTAESTQQILRKHLPAMMNDRFLIRRRGEGSIGRLFPESLVAILEERVSAGEVDPELLAWVQDVDVEEIDYPEPDLDEERAAERYASAVAHGPTSAELQSYLAAARHAR